MKLIHFPDTHDQKRGVQNDRLDKGYKIGKKKEISFLSTDLSRRDLDQSWQDLDLL